MQNIGLERIIKMLEIAHTNKAVFPATNLYCEGWMLRILLQIQSEGTECFPFTFRPGAKWFSEALIDSPFLACKPKDRLAERPTCLDGVVGHFGFRPRTKTGFILTTDSRQFVAIEAKMFSPLSNGTRNAPYYDQAARIMACIAWIISQSDRSVDDLESLGFYVIAPEEQITRGVFKAQMNPSSIAKNVERRISAYSDYDKYDALQTWYKDFFTPALAHAEVSCISWQSVIRKIDGTSIRDFYDQCVTFNKQARVRPR